MENIQETESGIKQLHGQTHQNINHCQKISTVVDSYNSGINGGIRMNINYLTTLKLQVVQEFFHQVYQ